MHQVPSEAGVTLRFVARVTVDDAQWLNMREQMNLNRLYAPHEIPEVHEGCMQVLGQVADTRAGVLPADAFDGNLRTYSET